MTDREDREKRPQGGSLTSRPFFRKPDAEALRINGLKKLYHRGCLEKGGYIKVLIIYLPEKEENTKNLIFSLPGCKKFCINNYQRLN